MLAVEKWSQGKHPLIALVAPYVASFARDLHDIYANSKSRKVGSQPLNLPLLTDWYILYRKHRQYYKAFITLVSENSTLFHAVTSIGATEHNNTSTLTPQQTFDKILHVSFQDYAELIKDEPLDADQHARVQSLLAACQTELDFMFFIYTPCQLFYKTSPSKLYHQAKLGNVSAIDKLLRLDPLLLHDPAIGQQIQKIRLFGKRSTYQNLIEAPLKPVRAKISRARIKAMLGAYIDLIAKELGQPLTSPELRKLFDAVAQDEHKRPIDTTLPDGEETFYKAIQRNRTEWSHLTTRTNKCASSVRVKKK